MKIGELFVQLGVKADTKKLNDFVSGLKGSKVAAFGAIASLAGIGFEIQQIVRGSLEAAKSLQLFQSVTGLSTDELQKWQFVAEQANVSTQAVSSSIMSLQNQISAIKLGEGDIIPFARLRIDPRQDAFRILEQLREKIRDIDRATAVNLISRMGISPEMIRVLQLSNEEFSDLMLNAKRITTDQQKVFLELKKSIVGLIQSLRFAGFRLAEIVAPKIKIAIEILTGIFDKMSGKALGIAAGLSAVIFSLVAIVALIAPIKILLGALGAIVSLMAALSAPIVALAAAVGLLLLVFDDIATFFLGGESLTGLMVEGLKKLLDFDFSKLIDKFKGLIKWWEKLGDISKIFTFAAAIPAGIPAAVATAGIVPAKAITEAASKIVNQTNNFNTTVNTTTDDPEALSNTIADEQKRQFSRAELQTNNQALR